MQTYLKNLISKEHKEIESLYKDGLITECVAHLIHLGNITSEENLDKLSDFNSWEKSHARSKARCTNAAKITLNYLKSKKK